MWTVIVGTAGVLAALAAIGRYSVKPTWKVGKRFGQFLRDWTGEEERPGHARVPSFPERMSHVETRAASVEHFVRGDLAGRLTLIQLSQEQSERHHDATTEAISRLDTRVSDHRRRNDEQITLLQRAVDDLRNQVGGRRDTDDHQEKP